MTEWISIAKGRVFSAGQVIEEGHHFVRHTPTEILFKYESAGPGFTTKYNITPSCDPFTVWKAEITDTATGGIKTKHYESSRQFRVAVAQYALGTDFDKYDKAPMVAWWLARSWIEGGEEELFFHVENRAMLDEVAAYYNQPVPYPATLIDTLDNTPQKIRFKSYDIYRLGEGNFVELVVGGVVFEGAAATQIRLYENIRAGE